MATSPFEIVIGHPQVYLAPSATAYPDVDSAPAAAWVLLGGGKDKQSEDGVTITHAQDLAVFRPGGKTLPTKRSRVSEDITIAVTIMDLTLEAYVFAINEATIATGTSPAIKSSSLVQGIDVATFAMLVRGDSAYGAFASQYQFPAVQQTGSPEVTYQKGEFAGLGLEFMVLDSDIELIMQTA